MNSVYSVGGYLAKIYPLKVGELQPFLLSSLCGGPLCSNPLDYVFGLIGLFESPPVTVDYGLTPRKLFLDVLQGVQYRTQKLDFLSWAWGNHAISASSPNNRNPFNLPAWAVDWSWRMLDFSHPHISLVDTIHFISEYRIARVNCYVHKARDFSP